MVLEARNLFLLEDWCVSSYVGRGVVVVVASLFWKWLGRLVYGHRLLFCFGRLVVWSEVVASLFWKWLWRSNVCVFVVWRVVHLFLGGRLCGEGVTSVSYFFL